MVYQDQRQRSYLYMAPIPEFRALEEDIQLREEHDQAMMVVVVTVVQVCVEIVEY